MVGLKGLRLRNDFNQERTRQLNVTLRCLFLTHLQSIKYHKTAFFRDRVYLLGLSVVWFNEDT